MLHPGITHSSLQRALCCVDVYTKHNIIMLEPSHANRTLHDACMMICLLIHT